MCFFLGLETLESNLKASDLSNSNNIFSQLDANVKVNVRLPKFEMTLPIQPKEILINMGMCNFSSLFLPIQTIK